MLRPYDLWSRQTYLFFVSDCAREHGTKKNTDILALVNTRTPLLLLP
jgi:hypothetical protein